VGCSLYAFVFTYAMLKVIDLIVPVRVGAEAESGLDEFMHGEIAYRLDEGALPPAADPTPAI